MFINPIKDGYLTSKFGWRKVDRNDGKGLVDSNHQGVDLARQPNSNVDILAAADGEIIRVAKLGTYGYVVMIKHTINGKRMDTNYAHLKNGSTLVKVGDKVKQGQKIATMGGTGGNYAPHLHFEIHNGAWLTNQPNAVDPAKYIKFYTKSEVLKMEKTIDLLVKQVANMSAALATLQKQIENDKKNPIYHEISEPEEWAEEHITRMKELSITDGTYLKRPTTREESIVFQSRTFSAIERGLAKRIEEEVERVVIRRQSINM